MLDVILWTAVSLLASVIVYRGTQSFALGSLTGAIIPMANLTMHLTTWLGIGGYILYDLWLSVFSLLFIFLSLVFYFFTSRDEPLSKDEAA